MLALILAVALSLTSALAHSPSAGAVGGDPCPLSPQTWERSLVSLATPTTSGWASGDGFFSATLNESQTIFLNGDTYFGTRVGETFTGGTSHRNSVLVHDSRRPDCWITLPAATRGGVFPTGGDPMTDWYWPAEPLVRGAEVMVPLSRWTPIPGWTEGESMWNFQWADDELRKYEWTGSELRFISARQLDFDPLRAPAGVSGPMYWFGALEDDPWVYMFGTSVRAGNLAHDAYLARVPTWAYFATTAAPLFPHAEFLTHTGWRKGVTFADLKPIITAESDSTVSAVKVNGRYHLITKELSIFGDEVLDYHSTSIEGPYQRHVLADLPPDAYAFTYGASVHEIVDNTGNGRISLSVNRGWNGPGSEWEYLRHLDRGRPILFESQLPGAEPAVAQGSQFQAIQPVRVFDSREPRFGQRPADLANPVRIDITDGGRVAIPAGATAVAYNLTITGQTTSGYASVTTDITEPPFSSVVNWTRGQETVTNGHVGALDADQSLAVHIGGRGSAFVVLDILGFYAPPTAQTSVFVPLVPTRVYDSRTDGAQVAAGTRRVIDFSAAAPQVPRTATAVAYNLTGTGTGSSGYLTVGPGDTTTAPPVSTLNWSTAGTTVANASKVAVADGRATLFAAGTSTHAIVDLFGYFIPADQVPAPSLGYQFYPLPPERAYDSRDATNPLNAAPDGSVGPARTIWSGLYGRVPAVAYAVEANLTVTGTTGSGFLRVAPAGSATATSVVNWTQALSTRANATTVPLSVSREFAAAVAGSGSHAVVDISGYYR